ncbi:RNA methyltransferase [Candidatus Saganbacteria bacterium]|nr:RNA methyltransferase [Candidatus Saganbacteria bacterium]
MSVYVALLHHPVYNKRHDIVSTCITGFDLHDIARSCLTYGVKKYYVVNPMPTQRQFAERIVDFWSDEEALEFNWTRAEAFKLIAIKAELADVIAEITEAEGQRPKIIGTSAKPQGTISFKDLKLDAGDTKQSYLILLGTGWGMTEEVLTQADMILEPIIGEGGYNHLSVRSANAIILDRLLGR